MSKTVGDPTLPSRMRENAPEPTRQRLDAPMVEGDRNRFFIPRDRRDGTMDLLRDIAKDDAKALNAKLFGNDSTIGQETAQAITDIAKSYNMSMDPERLADYARAKSDQVTQLEFTQYARQKFKLNDPYQLKRFQELFPEVMQSEEDVLRHAWNNTFRAWLISQRGYDTREDIEFLFQYENNKIPTLFNTYGEDDVKNLLQLYNKEQVITPGFFNPTAMYNTKLNKASPMSTSATGSVVAHNGPESTKWF